MHTQIICPFQTAQSRKFAAGEGLPLPDLPLLMRRSLWLCRALRSFLGFAFCRFALSFRRLRLHLRKRLGAIFRLRGRLRCRSHNGRRSNRTLPLALPDFALLARHCRGRHSPHCRFRPASTPGWRRRRRWRRRKRLQEFQSLCPRAKLSVEQQHKHVTRNLRILRQLRRNQQLRHLGQAGCAAAPAATWSGSS